MTLARGSRGGRALLAAMLAALLTTGTSLAVDSGAGMTAVAGDAPEARSAASIAPTTTSAALEPAALSGGQLTVQRIVTGLNAPLAIANAGDGSGRLFVVQRGGTVRVVRNRAIQAGTFLNITSKVASGGERGLLGLAFHPDFETNRYLYAFYTRASDGDLVLARYTANAAGTSASAGTELVLLRIEHSANTNHNGGTLRFGPDGYLYIAVGDGGGSGDPSNNGQDRDVLLGKVLRIDVDGTGSGPNDAYGIPGDNPFVGAAGLDEIWAYGLRNPWQISFDRQTGDLWMADVGQSRYEEINREPIASSIAGGRNYGWRVMEGKHCFAPSSGCNTSGKTLPIAEYNHDFGCSITGGSVYRGPSQRDLQGYYVFADFCSGRIGTVNGTSLVWRRTLDLSISSFGEDENGEIYFTDLGGRLYRVIAPEFDDIAGSIFIDDIHWLFYAGLTSGCGGGGYCPRSIVTRAQLASFVARALELPASPTDYFTDDNGSVYEPDINRIAHAGIAGGCAPNRYCPTRQVERAEMATILANGLELPATGTDYYDDDETSLHEANINRLAAAGIAGGCGPRRFCPKDKVTREQMAAFLRRAFEE